MIEAQWKLGWRCCALDILVLGAQGGPITQRIIEAGYETTLWPRREATLKPFEGTGANAAASPAELADNFDLICLCVMNDGDVREVFDAMYDSLNAGAIIAGTEHRTPGDVCRADQAGKPAWRHSDRGSSERRKRDGCCR